MCWVCQVNLALIFVPVHSSNLPKWQHVHSNVISLRCLRTEEMVHAGIAILRNCEHLSRDNPVDMLFQTSVLDN